VIEDSFCAGRPEWEEVGVRVVPEVHPYELIKVRLLNGSHSALAYPAYLMGFREVNRAMDDPLLAGFVRGYMEEVAATIPPVPGIDLEDYRRTLMIRFSNPAIRDQVERLAEDGSRKIPNAILPCIRERLAEGEGVRFGALALACWIRYLSGVDEQGDAVVIDDPLRDVLTEKARQDQIDPRAFLALKAVFGTDLGKDERLIAEVAAALRSLRAAGTSETLRNWLSSDAS